VTRTSPGIGSSRKAQSWNSFGTAQPPGAALYRAVQIQATGAEETPATGAVVGRCSFPP
jgi:hypothetical protein